MLTLNFRKLTMLLSILVPASAIAADIQVVDTPLQGWSQADRPTGVEPPPFCAIRISGEIVPGDYERFKGAVASWTRLDRNRPLSEIVRTPRGPHTICLHSPGGNYFEGLNIAKYLWESTSGNGGWTTAVEPGAFCFSACALIFIAGGEVNEGHFSSSRYLHVLGRLGFHAPYVKGLIERNYTASEVQQMYTAGVDASNNPPAEPGAFRR